MRAPGPWPQNPATIGNSTYTLQIVRRGRVTGHYHIYERRRRRPRYQPFVCRACTPCLLPPSLTPRHRIIDFPALPGTLHSTPLESITSHCHPCHRSYGFLFLGEQNRVFILSGIYYISISLSFLYVRFIVAHCNASVGGVGAVFCVLVFCISCNTPQLYYDTRQSIKYTVRFNVQTNKIQTKFISYLT